MYAQRAKATADRLVRRFGGGATATISRPNSLVNRLTGQAYAALAVDGTTSAGAGTITLDAVNLKGVMRKGTTYTIAGDATVYTTSADVTAASGALTGVTFTPVLAAEASDDAVVTITQNGGSYSYVCAVKGFREEDINGTDVKGDDRMVILSLVGEDLTDLSTKDVLTVQGTVEQIQRVLPYQPGDDVSTIRLHVGSR